MAIEGNDVWSSLTSIASQALSYKRDTDLAKINKPSAPVIQTTAAPSGSPTPAPANLFPGTFGPFPQAEVKQVAGQITSSPWMLVIAALLSVLLVMRFARR